MRETRLIRLSAQRPSFSFEPTTYALGGTFYQINLVNYGQVANNIHVECTWEETKDTETTIKMKKFFVMSLSNQGRATLHDIPIAEIVDKGQKLTLKIKCKDARGEDFEPAPLEINFQEINKEDETVAYEFSELHPIKNELDRIRRVIDGWKRANPR